MANEFIARNGIFALNNSQVTGSLSVSNGITGSLFGTASWALNTPSASVAQIANIVAYREKDEIASDGYLPQFTQALRFGNTVLTTVEQPDGKILVGGFFTRLNGKIVNYLTRLNSDGTEDTAFYSNLGIGFNSGVTTVAIQSDGKILVGGHFNALGGVTRNRLVRLNSDGTLDTTFSTNLGSGFNSSVYTVAIQSDGKIVVGGAFTTLNGTTRNRLVRLNSDGTLDTTFSTNLGSGFNRDVNTVVIQSDGKIVVGGFCYELNGNERHRLVRLNSDGTEDTAFYSNLGTGFASFTEGVLAVAIQSDGKIVVGGSFTSLNGTTRNRLVRLNSDGTLDTTFSTNLGSGFNGIAVYTIAIQSDGKILVGGSFTTLNGATRLYIVRLNSTGTVDTAFYVNLGTGFANEIRNITVQANGKILIGGAYASFNSDTLLKYLVRLNSNGTIDPTDYITSTALKRSSVNDTSGNITFPGTLYNGGVNTGPITADTITHSGILSSTLDMQGLAPEDVDELVYSYDVSINLAAMIDVHILMSDGSFRLMQINIANDSNGNYTYTEQSTSEVGNTSPITFKVVFYTNDNRIFILGTNTSPDYSAALRAYIRHITV